MNSIVIVIIKGIAIAVLMGALGVKSFSPEWWMAIVALNVMVQI